jgi:hypothetical protein
VWHLGRALEGPTFGFLDAELAQKGSTSPSKGPDVSLLAHIMTFLAFNVKTVSILKVNLVGCFNDLFLN